MQCILNFGDPTTNHLEIKGWKTTPQIEERLLPTFKKLHQDVVDEKVKTLRGYLNASSCFIVVVEGQDDVFEGHQPFMG